MCITIPKPDNLNLLTIKYLQKHYPQYTIGFSDHTIGIAAPIIAVGMGAKIIEKHITVDRGMKGTDQKGSLGPDGVRRMVRDIRLAEHWMGIEDMYIDKSVAGSKEKLERSIASNKDLEVGHVIIEDDLHMLSPGDGYKWSQLNEIIGKTITVAVPKNEVIYPDFLKQ